MHESRLVTELIAAAERSVPDDPAAITHMRLRMGALAATNAEALAAGLRTHAEARWHVAPEIEVVVEDNPANPDAAGVWLESVRVVE